MDDFFVTDALLQQRLEACGLSCHMLLDKCDQLFLFGSRAAGVHAENSDYDLLCVVKEIIARDDLKVTPGVDLIWISQSRLHTPEWLGSELAQHIAKYGRRLYGNDDWTMLVHPSKQAVVKKAIQIQDRITALLPRWDRLLPPYRNKYSRLVRRDVQRLQKLACGEAVPSSPILDREWQQVKESLIIWAELNLEPDLLDFKLLGQLDWKERGHCPINDRLACHT